MTISKSTIAGFVLGIVLGIAIGIGGYVLFVGNTGVVRCVEAPPVMQGQ